VTRRRHRPPALGQERAPLAGEPGARAARAPNHEEPTDEELCARLEAGDAAAAELVYERIVNVVDAVLYRLLGANDHEREDLAQQALERVIATIVSGRYQRDCSLTSWAALITQHLAIDAMRSRTRDRRVFDRYVGTQTLELVPDERQSTEQLVESQRRAHRLMAVLASISKTQAEAVVLHDLLGYDLPEVARLTGASVAAAQSRLVRGRRKALRLLASAERPRRAR
jgi:RNA polymerase sigma-70 factor (ECF subfamily)